MNNLNSILIEGVCNVLPEYTDESKSIVRFSIGSKRGYRENNSLFTECINVSICAFGKLGETVKNKLQKDQQCRVVGRIGQYADGSLYIVAEHVEMRPIVKAQKEVEEAKGGSDDCSE